MDNDLNNVKVPVITPHVDQQLRINFIKNEAGNDCITMEFFPEIPEVRTPPQAAAVNVANHIIRSFGLNANTPADLEVNNDKQSGR